MLADVDAGTDTPAAVGKVLSWKKSDPQKGERFIDVTWVFGLTDGIGSASELWTQLGAANDQLAAALSNLTAIYTKNPSAYSSVVDRLCGVPSKQVSP